MATPEETAAAREIVIAFIQQKNCSINFAIQHFNRQRKAGNLPNQIAIYVRQAWQRPRDCILTRSTYDKWCIAKKRRGHYRPLVRQKDFSIKPWHELAWLLKQRHPESKVPELHRQLIKKYANVSIHQLRSFYAFMRAEEAK